MDEADNNRLAELLIELAKGNSQVLSEIALLMQKILYSVGIMYFKNKEDTEDSIQELYIILYKKAKTFRQNTSASAWIMAIYKNWIKSQLRKRKVEDRYVKSEMQDVKTQVHSMDEKYIENRLYLKEIMSKLSDYERDLIIYYHWCKCTVREVAKILHKPRATIDNHLKKLEQKVKEM